MEFSEKDKATARQWFKRAKDLRDQRNYDYAVQCIITGLGFWTDAVEEGHMPLYALSIQRQQAGGKKPGMMETMKTSLSSKDFKQNFLNAATFAAKDPGNGTYLDALIRNGAKLGLIETLKFWAPKALDSIKREKKPAPNRLKAFRLVLVEASEAATREGDMAGAAWCLERAVESVEAQMVLSPDEMSLRDEQRDLAGRLTITKGKYQEGATFRDSIKDADSQKLLHDSERMKQGEQTLEPVLAAARAELATNPDLPVKINALVDALLKTGRGRDEVEAEQVLVAAHQRTRNYSFKLRADDIRLRKLSRGARALQEKAAKSGADEDAQQARLALMEERQTRLEVLSERAREYPTDLRVKFQLGESLFANEDFDAAIPMLQAAQLDPRHKTRCMFLIGRSFLGKGNPSEAAAVLKEAQEAYEITGDDLGKAIAYWLGRSCEAAGDAESAKAVYGRLLRVDYNYEDARQRLDALK